MRFTLPLSFSRKNHTRWFASSALASLVAVNVAQAAQIGLAADSNSYDVCQASDATNEQAAEAQGGAARGWTDDLDWMLGAAAVYSPVYVGSDKYEWKPRPLWSVRYGRFTLTGPRASAGRTFADEGPSVAGASAALIETDRWRVNLGLRLDSGRDSGDDPKLRGLPDIKRRVIYSINTRYKLSDSWALYSNAASDIRTADSGSTLSFGVGYNTRLAPHVALSATLNTTLADRDFMRNFHGVARVPAGSLLAAYSPSGGVRDVSVGTTLRYQWDRNWVGFTSLGATRLLGDAANSPLTSNKQQASFMFGVAYNSR